KLNSQDGRFTISYFDNVLPVDPQTVPIIFDGLSELVNASLHQEGALQEFRRLLADLRQLAPNSATDSELVARRQREIPVRYARVAKLGRTPGVAEVIEQALRQVNGSPRDPASFNRLHALLEAQAYRLAFWRVSGEEINYRRFFDINDLVGLRME